MPHVLNTPCTVPQSVPLNAYAMARMLGAVVDEAITAASHTFNICGRSLILPLSTNLSQTYNTFFSLCVQYLMKMDTTIYPRAGGQADFDFYKYNPSRPAGWSFCILFAIATVVHLGYIIPYRSWFFIPFTLGCAGRFSISSFQSTVKPQLTTYS